MNKKEINLNLSFIRKILLEAGYTSDFVVEYADNYFHMYGRLKSKKGFDLYYNPSTNEVAQVMPYTSKKMPIDEREIYKLATAGFQALQEIGQPIIFTPGIQPLGDVTITKQGILKAVSQPEEVPKKEVQKSNSVQAGPRDLEVKIEYPQDIPNVTFRTNLENFWQDTGKYMAKANSGYIHIGNDTVTYRIRYGETCKSKFKGLPQNLESRIKEEELRTLTNGTEHITIKGKSHEFWANYYYYINQGYKETRTQSSRTTSINRKFKTNAYEELWGILSTKAKEYLEQTVPSGITVTEESLAEAKWLLKQMEQMTDITDINGAMDMMTDLIPRIATKESLYARDMHDLHSILAREERVLQSIEAKLLEDTPATEENENFDPLGVEVLYPTAKETAFVKSRIFGSRIKNIEVHAHLVKIFKICDTQADQQLQTYQRETGHSQTSYLWHGSKACSWASILKNRLTAKPWDVSGAKYSTSGSAFGNGIYLAGTPYKSLGYTDIARNKVGILGLFEIVTQNKFQVHRSGWYTYNHVNEQGYDILFAKGGFYFRGDRDEYVVFDNRNIAPRYIVIFELR